MTLFGALPIITTALLLLSPSHGTSVVKKIGERADVCNIYCDGRDSNAVNDARIATSIELFSRTISVRISDGDNMGYASIENGTAGDELWMDRTFSGGTWTEDKRLGETKIPQGESSTNTLLYNVDNTKDDFQLGGLRACGKAYNEIESVCTPWVRSTVLAETHVDGAATALMQWYNEDGLWQRPGWMVHAHSLTAILDYMRLSGKNHFTYAINKTFVLNKDYMDGDFTGDLLDEVSAWGLAWIEAFDFTGQQKYLDVAIKGADHVYDNVDDHCGGGTWWTTGKPGRYKAAIPNEYFISLAATLHNHIPNDTKYLAQAIEVYDWFVQSGMITSENLVIEGLWENCDNDGGPTYTYNQGVILGACVELDKATGDSKYLTLARQMADATLASPLLNPDNILREINESDRPDVPQASYKGIFIRNLGKLNRHLPDRPYTAYLKQLADVIYERDRNPLNQYGPHYAGPFIRSTAYTQHSALDVFNAAM